MGAEAIRQKTLEPSHDLAHAKSSKHIGRLEDRYAHCKWSRSKLELQRLESTSQKRARNALLHNLSELLASQTRETISLPREKKNPDLPPPAPRQDYEYLSGVQDIGEQADRVLHAVQPPDQVLKKNSTSNHGHAVSPITATSTIMPPKKLQSKQVSHTDCECQTDAVPEDIYATLASVRSYNVQFPPYLPKPSSANPIGKNTQASDLGKGPASVSALAAVAAIAATSFITKALNYQEPKSEGVGLSIKPGACQTGLPTFQPLQYSQNVKNQDQNKHILAVQTSPQSQNPQPPKSISDVPSGNSANTPYLYSYQYDHSPPPPPAPVASALNPSGQRYNYLNEFNLPNFQVDQPFSYGDEVNLPCPTHLSTNRPPCIEVGNQDVLRLTDDGLSSKEPSTLAALSEPLPGCRSAITSPNVLRRTMFSERILQAKRAVDDGLFTRRQSRDQPVGLEPQTAMRCRKERGSNGKMMSHSLHGSLELEHLLSPPAYRRNTVPEFLTHSRLSGPAHSSGPYDRLSGINFQSPFGTVEVLNSQHRQMPVQIVKPAMRKSAALDSSGLDTGSPSDSTTSNASDTLFATENTKRNQSRERRPKSALISESNRLRRYRKADKRNGTHRTVVWIDELYDSPNFLEEKRDSANDTQESSSTRSNSQSLSCPERRYDTESTVCTSNTEVPSKFKERGVSAFDEHYSSSCVNVRPTDIEKYSQIAAEGALTEEGSEGSSKYHRSLPDPKVVSFGRSQK
ncbi:unnamed protein product [Calicophoron daubneyi]|uniref:Uncharacterized protein n=1 Tax=Calicophoron daubneyi TaxID=300641 RepID=A0AAV2TW65_CALDB